MHTSSLRWPAAALALLLAGPRPAAAVQVATGTGSAQAGQTVDIALTTSGLTGFDVVALQFEITYNATYVHATDVIEAGSLVGAAGWGDAAYQVTEDGASGRIRVGQAGVTPLSGSGALIRVRFQVDPARLSATSTTLTLPGVSFLLNEGIPIDTTSNGSITILATPSITVSPNSGEIVRAQTLGFSVSGGVTNPVTWSTTDPAIATISGAGVLTGNSPGEVRVVCVDAAGRRDTTNDVIVIRGMGLTAGTASVFQGNTVDVPITVTELAGLGIRSGQFRLAFNPNLLTATQVLTPPGTLLNGWGPVGFGAAPGQCTVDFAGAAELTGAGVLCHVRFLATGTATGTTPLAPGPALFDEVLPARTVSGTVTVTGLPTITVAPDEVSLLAGQTRQYTISGAATPPITWTVLDPAVATISASGLLSALAGGTTQVRAVDAVGATDLSTSVRVYDLRVALDTVSTLPGSVVYMPVVSDRQLGDFGIRSLEYTVTWSSPHITSVTPLTSGLIHTTWAPGDILTVPGAGRLDLVGAGAVALPATGTTVHALLVGVSDTAPIGSDLVITLARVLCNEGAPDAQPGPGLIRVRSGASVPERGTARLALGVPVPNPTRAGARLAFVLPAAGAPGADVRLELIGLDGRRVRTLCAAVLPAGEHEVRWDGRDERGHPVTPGLYMIRLVTRDGERVRKMVVTR